MELTDEQLAALGAKIAQQRAARRENATHLGRTNLARVLPRQYAHATWDHLLAADPAVPAPVLESLNRWCERPSTNLLILGDLRVGKSFAAAACLHRVIQDTHTVAFWPCAELLEVSRERPAVLNEALRVKWLVLDDMGTEQALHPINAEKLGVLINRRDQEGLPIITTSCLDPKMLASWLGPRSFERIKQGVRIQWSGAPRNA